MTKEILVTYARYTGFTVGVAESIGRTFSESGLDVQVIPMRDVVHPSPYAAMVAGSAIQSSRWLLEAMEFMGKSQETSHFVARSNGK
jgi:menaquinone-dependent protoporphyrinogen IX oxidase